MKTLANYVMKGRMQAVLASTVSAVLSLLLAPLSYVSGAIVALVTLRDGWQQGLLVWLLSAIVMGALALGTMGNAVIVLLYAIAVWIPLWIAAIVLRKTISLPLTLSVVTLIGVLAVAAIHAALGDPVAWWSGVLNESFAPVFDQAATLDIPSEQLIATVALAITGFVGAALVLGIMFSLLLARWWQAILYNPGGFGQEFRALKLDKSSTIIASLILLWTIIGSGLGSLSSDMAFVVIAAFSIPGFALVHDWIEKTKASALWPILLYGLLLFVAPHLLIVLTLAAFIDAWADLRRFIKIKPATPME